MAARAVKDGIIEIQAISVIIKITLKDGCKLQAVNDKITDIRIAGTKRNHKQIEN